MKKKVFIFFIISTVFTMNFLLAETKKETKKKNDNFLRAKPYIQNEELRAELENLRKQFDIEEKNVRNAYKEKMEALKISRKNELKALKTDFASRRDLLFKKHPPKKRKKPMMKSNRNKPDKVKSDKNKTPIIRKK